MFSHVGMLNLIADATDGQKQSIFDGLAGLVGTIDGLVRVSGGHDLGLTEGNASLVFVLEFEDEAAWAAYRTHEAHAAVITECIAPVLVSKHFVQTDSLDVLRKLP